MDNIIKHEANNTPIEQRKVDGYINATDLCKATGKRLDRYFENQSTKEYLQALADKLNVEVSEKNPFPGKAGTAVVQIFQGINQPIQGTWVHPKVAIHLGMWLSPEFAVQVIDWVESWMSGKTPSTPPAPQPQQKLFGPSKRFPAVTQEIFNAAPLLDQIHWAESPEEELERRQRERKEFWRL